MGWNELDHLHNTLMVHQCPCPLTPRVDKDHEEMSLEAGRGLGSGSVPTPRKEHRHNNAMPRNPEADWSLPSGSCTDDTCVSGSRALRRHRFPPPCDSWWCRSYRNPSSSASRSLRPIYLPDRLRWSSVVPLVRLPDDVSMLWLEILIWEEKR